MAQTREGREGGLKRLPLHEEHQRLGARLVGFAGWSMPLQYTSIIDEHLQVRCRAGLFDVSHMGRLLLRGSGALAVVQRLVASDVSGLAPGQARYTVLLTPEGGIRDDLIVYRREDGFLLIVNAGQAVADREWIAENALPGTEIDDLTELTSLFALQGPRALGLLASLGARDVSSMKPFTFIQSEVAGIEATIMRTGYTGEDGAELLVDNGDALPLWRSLLAAGGDGVAPAGLGARDTLRLEAALLLHGSDISPDTNPFEARLGWLVDLDRPDFVGREALVQVKEKGPGRLLVGLAGRANVIPRTGDSIFAGERIVGSVTSGSISPVLGHPIALGFVGPDLAGPGTLLTVLTRTHEVPVTVVERPFYKKGVTPLPRKAACTGDESAEESSRAERAETADESSRKEATGTAERQ